MEEEEQEEEEQEEEKKEVKPKEEAAEEAVEEEEKKEVKPKEEAAEEEEEEDVWRLTTVWRFDLAKCVDSSPLIIGSVKQQREPIFILSFKKFLFYFL